MTIDERQELIIRQFGEYAEWIDRYEHIINIGAAQPPLAKCERVPENIVRGCQSKVWLVRVKDDEGRMTFRAQSDTMIVNGIVALIVSVVNGNTEEEIANADLFFIKRIGLGEHLSTTRSNGIRAVIDTIKSGVSC